MKAIVVSLLLIAIAMFFPWSPIGCFLLGIGLGMPIGVLLYD